MKDLLANISDVLSAIRWDTEESPIRMTKSEWRVPAETDAREWMKTRFKRVENATRNAFLKLIGEQWPLKSLLEEMIRKVDDRGRQVGAHVAAVIASINELLPPFSSAETFLVSNDNSEESREFDQYVKGELRRVYNDCWGWPSLPVLGGDHHHPQPIFGPKAEHESSESFLRVAALYHDVGKTLSVDHHVPRGVHLMRDTTDGNRLAIEGLFETLSEKRHFWALLAHHDVFGVLCTGEASLPALVDIIAWTSETEEDVASGRSSLAQVSLLDWLNIADSNAAMVTFLGGISTVEAHRHLEDWSVVQGFLGGSASENNWSRITRDEFKRWALEIAGRPDRTILRIARLVASCYRRAIVKCCVLVG